MSCKAEKYIICLVLFTFLHNALILLEFIVLEFLIRKLYEYLTIPKYIYNYSFVLSCCLLYSLSL